MPASPVVPRCPICGAARCACTGAAPWSGKAADLAPPAAVSASRSIITPGPFGAPTMAEFPNLNVNGGVVTSLSSPEAAGPLFTSPKRYYLTRDGKAVGEDSPDRHTLLVAEGGTIPLAHARELGLVEGDQTEAEAGVSGAPRLAPEPPKEGTVARESAEESRVPAPAPARPAAPRPQGK